MYVRIMVIGMAVPEGLAAIPPGPELATLLDALEVSTVPNDDIVDVLIAQSRQLAHEQARMFAALTEVIHRRPFAGPSEIRRSDVPEPYGADEVRAALAWSRRGADTETDLAYALVCHLPLVQAALLAGRIDRGKAWAFARHLSDLTPAQIEVVCQAVLPAAGRLTPGQIGERLKRLILEIDPGYYERRYRRAVHDRQIVGYLAADGTATVSLTGLPAEDAAAALDRIDSLARACRRAGHPATLDQLRADIALGLLDGTLHTLTRAQIIDALLTRPSGGYPGTAHPHPARARTAATSASTNTPGRSLSAPTPTTSPAARSSPPVAKDHRVGIEIRVALSTLLGHDERAGEIPGWGPVTAATARATVTRQRRAAWRWAVLDSDGRLLTEGITRRRPSHLPTTGPRGGIVELHIPESTLTDIAVDPAACGDWAAVIADIAQQHQQRDTGAHLRNLDAHPRDRFPRAGLRRHVQIRDRTCTFPGCRTPAHRADLDHTRDHAEGGTTTADDLSPGCRHDHMLKTEGGWQLDQPEPGVFRWTSPLGRTYPVRSEPLQPPPLDPLPREKDPRPDLPPDSTGTTNQGDTGYLDDPPPF
jgi:hypothetical protein